MKQSQKISAIVLVLAVVIATSSLMATNALTPQAAPEKLTAVNKLQAVKKPIIANTDVSIKETPLDIEKLKERIPKTLEETEALVMPVRSRFLMWTKDLTHVMWGSFGNGHFVGTDNLGRRAWGIYYQGVFAGFYDGEFFYGRYSNGCWKAQNLFGLPQSYGRYTVAPFPVPTTAATP